MAGTEPSFDDRPAAIRRFYADPPVCTRQLRINAIGAREWMPPSLVDRPRGTGDWLIMAFSHPMRLRYQGDLVQVAAPFLLVWTPRDGHYYGRTDQRWCHSWIHCQGELVDRLVTAERVPTAEPIHGFDPRWLDRCVAAMDAEISGHTDPDATIIGNLLHNLLRQAARSARRSISPIPPVLLAVRRRIEANFTDRLTLAELARPTGWSVQHLCGEFKRHFGASPIDYAIRLRLHQARVLLADRNRRVAEVAAAVGYHDVPHFSRLFRKRYATSPGSLRRAAAPS